MEIKVPLSSMGLETGLDALVRPEVHPNRTPGMARGVSPTGEP